MTGSFMAMSDGAGYSTFLLYGLGFLLLSALLIRSLRSPDCAVLPPAVKQVVRAFAAFCLLFLMDGFFSTATPYPFAAVAGSLWALMPFFMIVLFLKRQACNRLIGIVAVSIGILALVAIGGSLLEQQAIGPKFGFQVSAALQGTSACCPLCMAVAPLCLRLAIAARHLWMRSCYYFAFAACLAVQVSNDWHSAWIGATVSLIYLLMSRLSPVSSLPMWKRVGVGVVALITVAILVPTESGFETVSKDPATVGQARSAEESDRVGFGDLLLGSGFATYPTNNGRNETDKIFRWRRFDLLKMHSESLYVRLVRELGLVGLALYLYLVWTCVRYESNVAAEAIRNMEDRWLVVGIHAGLLALLVAGLTDSPLLQANRSSATFLAALLLGVSISVGRDTLPAQAKVVSHHLSRYGKWLACLVGSIVLLTGLWQALAVALQLQAVMPTVSRVIARVHPPGARPTAVQIPSSMEDALVAAEDSRFFQHHGIDWLALHRALRRDIRTAQIAQGGSTITMQVARYLFLSESKTASRKLAELYLADYIEKRLTKAEILQLYLQNVDFGMHSPGMDRAAVTFFGKSPARLTLGEAAYLVGNLPKPPTSPSDAESDRAEERRLSVLARIEAFFPGKYTPEALEAARNESMVFVWQHKATPNN